MKCLYRSWTEQVNGKSQKMQSCSCDSKIAFCKDEAVNPEELGLGAVKEVFSFGTHKFNKHQVINCKYPECL